MPITRRLLIAGFAGALAAQTPASIDTVAWIAGAWTGKMGRADIEEHWTAPNGGAMLGVSRTVAGSRMVMFEFLRIVEKPEGLFYIAQPGGRPPVEFKLTRASDGEAVFENPQHDHPKIIVYKREADGSLTATIEGDEKGKHVKQAFRFQRGR